MIHALGGIRKEGKNMGHNYNKFYHQPKNTENSENNVVVEENKMGEVFEGVINEIVEEADVLTNEEVETLTEEDVAEVEITEEKSLTKGTVTGCARLNVRKEADKESDVLCVINKGEEVTITLEGTTEDFYKVCTSSGVEGFCMKKFIEIK